MSTNVKKTFVVDGRLISASDHETILQALLENDVDVPHICYHPALGPIQTCDTCMVDVGGNIVRACATPVEDGMEVRTKSVAARFARKEAMDRILKNHDLYCTVCDNNNGNCTVHNTTMAMDIDHQSYPFRKKPYEEDLSNPFYRYDPNQCILCGRCVEACQNLQVSEVLSIAWDREIPRVIWDNDVPINESSCVSCGHCVTVCPCNALMEKNMIGKAGFLTGIEPEPLQTMIDLTKAVEPGYRAIFSISEMESAMRKSRIQRTKTVCTYCGVGCSFDVWTKDREILKVEPQMEAPTNQISTCIKGKFGWDFVNSPDRLTKPLIRRGDAFYEASWDEALDLVAKRLTEIRLKHGDDAVAFISSSKCTNEENYLIQKLARAVMHTNNVDNCSRYCQSPATEGLRRTVGYGGDTGSVHDLAMADLVIIVGANPAESHPVLSTRLRRAKKKYGQKHIVIDLRRNGMAEKADMFVRPEPGTDLVLLSAVTKYIIDQGWQDQSFIDGHVDGYAEFVNSLAMYSLAYAERTTGVPQSTIKQLASMIHEAKSVCICWAMGVTQHLGGSETSTAICNLLLVTGNMARPGTGAYPLRGHNNVQGAGDMGCNPVYLPGYERVDDPLVRAKYEQAWGVELPTTKGLDNHEMVEAIHDGKLRAMLLQGEEMALVDSNSHYVRDAFTKLDFFVVMDVFFSKTAEFADVVLPASPSLEKEGTFTNTERRIQRLYQVLEPLGESKPDWIILQELARRLGADWNYQHPREILEEMASLAELMKGVTYERLEGYRSLQWPVAEDGTDSPLLYTDGFPFPNGRARLVPAKWIEPTEFAPEYDLHLNNGRMLEHFHEGNLTYRVAGIKEKIPTTYLEVSPELAKERGIETGALVRLTSPFGQLKLPVVVTDRVQGYQMYLPMNTSNDEEAINILTSSESDVTTHTPAYKELRVRMEVLRERGKSPLTPYNYRLGHPNPQPGVQVEKKWARAGYVPVEQARHRPERG
ncbi:formate dehydrogenase major subunit [Alicyclobacillus hesperidum]|uniref:Formate dehydrogenase major subunit n=1 Tax=Alicyclobacillus hesperidum TaxID=89784 RepID=A0A1H2U2U2_9BACL|nr:formate dehydrogenase subunit alpha [Alicyclobacillus hesperidum]SDW50350.1 formate dehydrogenase major subunit [Alicyclobacillus hesperidum]